MQTLCDILRSARDTHSSKGWLYLPQDVEWTTDTEGVVLDLDLDETEPFDDLARTVRERKLVATLDRGTLRELYIWAARLEDPPSDATLLETFLYYYRFDAPLPCLGAPDPPPAEEIYKHLDREFYNLLGPERESMKCKRDGCRRGAVTLSVFCRVHQFENVHKRLCPFDD